jgi:methionine-rich copper-binding protein CopC
MSGRPIGRGWPRLVGPLVAVALAAVWLVNVPSARAAACDPVTGNPIACENTQPGSPPSEWDVTSGEGTTIQGFSTPFSVDIGQTVQFKIQSPANSYAIDIYRMGYYGGDGARKVASITPNISVSRSQPTCSTNTASGLVDCGNWGVSASWAVPSTAVSGVYFAHIYRTDGTSDENQIPFVVRNDASHSDILFKTSDETWQAYNDWGGYSLYKGTATDTPNSPLDAGRAVQVSYNRPFATRFDTPGGQDYFFYAEYPTIRFLEENGYDISYTSGADIAADTGGKIIQQHKTLTSTGHDEYWSGPEVANVTAARDAGVNLAFFSGNEVYWKTRWAADGSNTPYRTLITYKESLDDAQTDPQDPPTWTGSWWDPRFSPPGDGGHPQNALSGQLWMVNEGSYAIEVPSAYAKLRFWRNSTVASLGSGQTATLPSETLGYEWDEDVDNGFRPAGLIDMSSTTQTPPQVMQDYNEDLISTQATHHLTLYRAASGALVFGAGTVQWAWGLDSNHDGDANNAPSPAMQQATVNLLADMHAQPVTLMSGLTQATASTDTTPPTSQITSPAPNATLANGATVTVTGTATDSDGGVVAGVEVSPDGGHTWHPVTSMSAAATSVTWSYTWSATGNGPVTIESRATDDSGNIETPGSGVTVAVNCPCGLFGQNYTPSITAENDGTPLELGVKFQSNVSGWVAGVRFYKGTGNTGTHTGSFWSATGTQLATGTFTNETSSGWQTLKFTNPVQISANTTYIASYYAPSGHYAADINLFYRQPVNSPPLTGLQAGISVANGVFNLGGPGFPAATFQGTSYGVDVIFDTTQPPGAPPSVISATPFPGSSSDPVTTDPTVTLNKAVVPSTASFVLKDSAGNTVAGSTSFDGTDTIATFTPTSSLSAGTTYTATASGAQDQFGQAMTPYSFSFTTAKAPPPAGQCPCSIWTDATTPTTSDSGDSSAIELGMKFKASGDGTITGIRFYKNRNNTGTHTGTLWTASGTQLATGTFSNESTEGWQELDFTTPVSITAGTEYVAGYHTTTGHYSDGANGFGSEVTNGPLTALSSGESGGNGVYAYGTGGFPGNSYNATNYWVDVVYQPKPDPNPPAVSSTSPSAGASSEQLSTTVAATFNKPVKPGSASFTLADQHGTGVSGTASLDSSGTVLTFTPAGALTAATTYTATVNGATNTSGVAMTTPYSWSFTTSGASACPCTLFPSDATPATPATSDPSSVELGVQFKPDTSGWISGVRFYKGTGNTGSHTGSLWSSTGTLLARGTFTDETGTGWQTLTFPNPVAVSANQAYVASYHAPNGHYSVSGGFFSTAGYDNSPLHAPQDGVSGGNGVYAYGNSAFPQASYNGTNYWVDPIFWITQPPGAPPAVGTTDPVDGQTSVPTTAAITATFDKAIQPGTVSFTVTGPNNSAVAGSLSYDSSTDTSTFSPSSPLAYQTTYSATVSGAQDAAGHTMTGPYTWTFTTAKQTPPPGQCPCSIWADSAQPSIASVTDQTAVTVGVKFRADVNGYIKGIRFYKGPGNTGTHIGSLWDATGNLLAQATFSGESAAGWQEVDFSASVPVTANTTYVASYFAPDGGYAVDVNAFANAGVDNAPLHALQAGVDGGNGIYFYGSQTAFPQGASTSNYWVDVVFSTTP